jgi:MATE family multidrug resistance protein
MSDANPPAARMTQVYASLLSLAAPMLLGQAGQVLLQLTDTVMVGRVGPVPLAGAALAGNLVMFALYFAYGSLGAVAPTIGQAFGAKDFGALRTVARASVRLALAVGTFLAVALTALVPFLGHMGQPPEVVAITGGYLALLAWSMPAAMLCLVLGQTAEAVNRPWPVMGIMAGAVALNAGLNFVLIFGHLGFPALGLEGAGWATFISRLVQAAALLAWIRRDRVFLALKEWQETGSVAATFRTLLREGLPVAGQDVLEGGSFAVGSLMLGWLGTTALAANQVTISIASLAWMFPIALSTAASVRVAQAAGAGDLAGARRVGLAAVSLGVGIMGACAGVYITSGHFLAGLFTSDPAVVALAGQLVTIAGIYQISDAIQSVSLGSLRGLLDNRVPLVANAVCYWLLSLPTVYVLTFVLDWGAVGVWVGYLPWMVLTGIFFLWRFLRRTRVIQVSVRTAS